MFARLILPLLTLPALIGCWDTNVRDVFRYKAVYSMDGERIATIRYRYEGYDNIVTNGSGPGRREFRFSLYTQATPRAGRDGTASVQGFPDGLGERFDYDGHLENAYYVHNAARRYVVGRFIDGDDPRVPVIDRTRVQRPAFLRIGVDGRPQGNWRFLSDREQVFEHIQPTDDGAFIAVVTRRDLGEEDSAFVVTFYDGDTLEVVHTEDIAGDLDNRHSGWIRGRWHKSPVGRHTRDIAADVAEAHARALQTTHPASPAWPGHHGALMAQIERRRTLADFEWSFGALIDDQDDRHRLSARLFTFRSNGRVERAALSADALSGLEGHRQDSAYRESADGTTYHRYLAEEGQDHATLYAPVPIAVALQLGPSWDTHQLVFKYGVTFGADYPYEATFGVDDIDRSEQILRGRILRIEEAYAYDELLDYETFTAVRLDWTRDVDGLLRTCFTHALDQNTLAGARVDADDLDFGCDGAAWDNLSNHIGRDCDGAWGGAQTASCDMDCGGAWGGDARLDGCGVCDADPTNDNTTCDEDCAGVYGGGALRRGDQCVQPAEMALVPAGEFIARTRDRQRRVVLPAFYMDLYEVTAGEYRRCVEAGACVYRGPGGDGEANWGEWSEARSTYRNNRNDHPINFVSWSDASDYCAWVDKRLPPPSSGRRRPEVPTDAPTPGAKTRPPATTR